jgi:integrase
MVSDIKQRKKRALQEGCIRDVFVKKFGRHIEEYTSFQRATEGLSKKTIDGYQKILAQFCTHINKDPDVIIEERRKDIADNDPFNAERYERIVRVYVNDIEAKNLVAVAHLNRIQGFFANNSHRFRLNMRNLKISKGTKKKKYSPSQEQMQTLNSYAATDRDHLMISLLFHNGVLPVDQESLKIGDLPVEPWMYYKKKRSKTGESWHGVITPDISRYLRAYLKIRGGKKGDPLFIGRSGPMTRDTITMVIKQLIMQAGFDEISGFSPKCLRDGFEDALVDAEVYHKVKEALMGHGGSIEHQYGSAKKLEERIIEAMRKTYPLLCLTENNPNTSNVAEKALQELINMLPELKIVIQNSQTKTTPS